MTNLTEQELAQYVDALVLKKQDQLPTEILEHVAECFECKADIMAVLELSKSIGLDAVEVHPFFCRGQDIR